MAGTNKKLTTAVENDTAYWRNVPAAVWTYKLGGNQVLKKRLSYREHKVLGRPPKPRRNPTLHKHRPPHNPEFAGDVVTWRTMGSLDGCHLTNQDGITTSCRARI